MPTKIEWCDETWSTVTGCTPVSSGCKNCYAKRMSKRLAGRCGYPKDEPFNVTLHPERLEQPFHWKKPKRIFVCSMGDLFHDRVPFGFIAAVFGVMAANPQHTFLVLTKREKRMEKFFRIIGSFKWGATVECADNLLVQEIQLYPNGSGPIHCKYGPAPDAPWPLPNVHIGVSVEDQPSADKRIPTLLKVPAVKRIVSYEPALGPVDFKPWMHCTGCGYTNRDKGIHLDHHLCKNPTNMVDQIIVGAETGSGKRPMDLDWARSVRDQCQAAGTSFFFKKDSNGNHELDGRTWEEL